MHNHDILQRLSDAIIPDDNWLLFHDPKREDESSSVEEIEIFSDEETPAQKTPAPINDIPLHNELADADRFIQYIIGKAWYCSALAEKNKSDVESGWLVWDGTRLAQNDTGAMMRHAKAVVLELTAECMETIGLIAADIKKEEKKEDSSGDAIKALKAEQARELSRCNQLQSEKRMKSMMSLARMDERIHIAQNELDTDPDILNCQNGVVHLPTGELLDHDPKYRCTRITTVPYKPDADRTVLNALLNRALMKMGDDDTYQTDLERIAFLKQSVGHALYGHQRLQKFYLCIGKGGDGKGTLFEALLDSLGDYGMKADMQSFVKQKMSGHRIRDDVANMAGARIIIASEINRGEALDGAFMKTISGEDIQRVRHLFGKEFQFRPICTLFMQANHQPYVDSQDHAIWRRLVNIPFGPVLTDAERDPQVRAALHDPETGGAALLAWAVEGAIETYNIQRIDEPESVSVSTSAYRHEMNPLANFIIEDLRFSINEKAENTYVEQKSIKPAFEAWLAESGLDDKRGYQISGKRIATQLRACGAYAKAKKINGKNTKCWFGMTLRKDHDEFLEFCHQSFVPEYETHLEQLAASKAIEVTWLPHSVLKPTGAHGKLPMGNFSAQACRDDTKTGYQVTDDNIINLKNKNNINNNINKTDDELPDLDSIDGFAPEEF